MALYLGEDRIDNVSFVTVDTGSGGSGLEYETGTYTPTADIRKPTISFTNSHTDRPFFVMITDTSETTGNADDMLTWFIGDWYDVFVKYINNGGTDYKYARIVYLYKTGSSFSASANTVSNLTGTTSTCMPYFLTNSEFMPDSGSNSRTWRSGRTYKWIAVWKPTS